MVLDLGKPRARCAHPENLYGETLRLQILPAIALKTSPPPDLYRYRPMPRLLGPQLIL
jgi:hypothetical protein